MGQLQLWLPQPYRYVCEYLGVRSQLCSCDKHTVEVLLTKMKLSKLHSQSNL